MRGMKTQSECPKSEEQKAIERCQPLVGDEWTQVCGRIPVDVEGLAKETKALQRKREVRSALDLLRMVLAYSVCDWSLRLVGSWATVIGLCNISDVAVRKRLRNTEAWLGRIIGRWLEKRQNQLAGRAVRVRLIDGSTVSEPGSQGIDWRLHAKYDLESFSLTGVEVTDIRGGETLARHAAEEGEIVVADRGYAHRNGVGVFLAASAYVVVRSNGRNLPLETAGGQKFDVLKWLKAQTSQQPGEVLTWVTTPQGRFDVRLIAQRLPKAKAEEARRRVRRNSRKKGYTPSELSLVGAGFVLLVSNLPESLWSAEEVLALYRLRWPIELLFKRLKSILDLDQLRAKDPVLAQVYLLGKLLAVLILEEWTRDLRYDLPEWFDDTVRPLSLWRWTVLWGDLLRQAIRGPLTLARCLAALPRLARYLRNAPRKRRQQAAHARQWLGALNATAVVFHNVDHGEPVFTSP
jgi:hypothetical protein